MRFIRTTCIKKRTGVSSILGTIIFVGIMFTAVIPMMLVMKRADTVYTQTLHEVETADEERENEIVEIYAYPVEEASDDLKIRVSNNGVVPIRAIRIWINDDNYTQSTLIDSQEYEILGPITVQTQDGESYVIKVTTERGNTYTSVAGTLYFQDGSWFTPSLGIHVIVLNWFGKYQIYAYNTTWSSPNPYETTGMDIGDVTWTEVVNSPGNYNVAVKKKIGGNWQHLPGSPIDVIITWPGGSPVINVIADGRDV